MKNLIYLFCFAFIGTVIFSCAKDNDSIDNTEIAESVTVENRNNDVCLCHKNDGNNPKIIYVNENAVDAHLAHGDVLLIDEDEDGYVTNDNNCGVASGDCNDDDDSVNPGAEEELCDGIDNDCNPDTEDNPDGDGDGVGVCDDCDDEDAENYPGNEEICGDGQDNNCDGEVDEDCGAGCCLDELIQYPIVFGPENRGTASLPKWLTVFNTPCGNVNTFLAVPGSLHCGPAPDYLCYAWGSCYGSGNCIDYHNAIVSENTWLNCLSLIVNDSQSQDIPNQNSLNLDFQDFQDFQDFPGLE